MYYFQYVENLVSKAQDPKLSFGKAVHKGLATYYMTSDRVKAAQSYKTYMDEQVQKVLTVRELTVKDNEYITLGDVLLEAYIQFARSKDNFEPLRVKGQPTIEQQFSVPFYGVAGCTHDGTFDGIVRNSYGNLMLLEHKTASTFPSPLELQLNVQASMYLLAAKQLFDEPVHGIVYNVLRKTNPKRARTPVIQRFIVGRTDAELKASGTWIARLVNTMLKDEHFDPRPGFHCTWKCAYTQLCTACQEGVDYTLLANHYYTKRKEEDDKDGGTYSDASEG